MSFTPSPYKSNYHASPSTGRAGNGVHYFAHFPKDFLKPYGLSTQLVDITDEAMGRRLKPLNCEWLTRPGIAVSEFAETIHKNRDRSSELECLCHPELKSKFDAIVSEIEGLVLPLWTRSGNQVANHPLSREDIVQRFHRIQQLVQHEGGELFDDYVSSMIDVGSAMFATGIHLRALSFIMNNLETSAALMKPSENVSRFKSCPTMEEFSNCVFQDYIGSRSVQSRDIPGARRRLIDHLSTSHSAVAHTLETAQPSTSETAVASPVPYTGRHVAATSQYPSSATTVQRTTDNATATSSQPTHATKQKRQKNSKRKRVEPTTHVPDTVEQAALSSEPVSKRMKHSPKKGEAGKKDKSTS